MEAKKRFKLYKSGKLWCCAAVAFGVMAFGTVNGQADDATPATTTSQVSMATSQAVTTPAADNTSSAQTSTDPAKATTPVAGSTTTTAPADNGASVAKTESSASVSGNPTAESATTTTLNVQQQAAAPVTSRAVTTAAYAATNNLTTADTLDISAYQPNISEETFRQYHNQGINNVVVKLSESTGWTNAYAQQQVSRAQAAGMAVSAYHFVRFTTAAQAQAEAQLFARMARSVGLGNDTLMIADVEDVPQTRYGGIVNNLNVFFQTLSSLGYTNHGVYTGLSYDRQYNVSSTVGKARTWVAMYYLDYSANATRSNYMRSLGYGAWQYTDRWNGSIDASIDFGMFANYAGHQTTSAANLDNFNINANNNTLDVAGWFADNNNEGKNNRYVILLDQDNGNREIVRQQVSAVSRPDVANAFSGIYGAGNSGFNASFALTGSLADAIAKGHRIQVIIRYTSSGDGNSDYNDHWFNGTAFNTNIANLDQVQITNGGITIVGWHAADQAAGRNLHELILLDSTTGKELARQTVNNVSRADVGRTFGNVYNSGNSGFNVSFNMNDKLKAAIMNGDSLQVISRYSSQENGGNIDYWFTTQALNNNIAAVDDFSLYNGHLRVTGWHAADKSVLEPNQLILLIDNQTGKEVARVNAATVKRPDIARLYPSVINSGNSGFVADFNIAEHSGLQRALLEGHSLRVLARYCDSESGEGNVTDYWSKQAKSFANDKSSQRLESFGIDGNNVRATGWYADSRSAGAQAMYVILLDATTGREVGRQQVTNGRVRADVAAANPEIYGASQSGFDVAFNIQGNDALTAALKAGHQLQVVARYTNDKQSGEGTFVHYFFAPQSFQQNLGYLDSLTMKQDGSVQASGWHISNQIIGRPYHYVILFDATQGREITRVRVSNQVDRPDIAKLYPNVYGSATSGFSVNFASSAAIRQAISSGHSLQVIDRYSAAQDGNSDYVDLWSSLRRLSL
ncbi:GH25 family lysozyme [Limosilactobacillus oris]|uniref:GH25 family lysozyme n=1 Tax=Limosilactobacillus oris TaxID=1632 RepID=UPI00242C700D|nr:GH25 family lysozyme [Limosilactobacillus oris]